MGDSQLYVDRINRILDPEHRELQPERGALGFGRANVRGVNAETREVEAVVSTAEIDRYGEAIAEDAWTPATIAEFMRNPVLLAGHQHASDSGSPTVIGHWLSLKRVPGAGLVGVARFADTPLADEWFQLFVQGALRAFSVGFIAREWEMREAEIKGGKGKQRVRTFTAVDLLEISAVAIPANASALVRAAGVGQVLSPGGGDDKGGGKSAADDAGDAGGGSGGGPSNRKLRAMIHREVKPVVRDLISAEFRRVINVAACGGEFRLLCQEMATAYGYEMRGLINAARGGGGDAMDHIDPEASIDDLAGARPGPGSGGLTGEEEALIGQLREMLAV